MQDKKGIEAEPDSLVQEQIAGGGVTCCCRRAINEGILCCDGACDFDTDGDNGSPRVEGIGKYQSELGRRALRFNKGKPQLSYLMDFPKAIEGIAKVMEFGATKYPRNNWKKGSPVNEVVDSMLRHLSKARNGQKFDAETSIDHLFHVLVNAMFLAEFHGDLKGFKPRDPARTDTEFTD